MRKEDHARMIISDSSSLILLAKANILESLVKYRDLVIPKTVYKETVERGREKGREDAYLVGKLINSNKIRLENPKDETKDKIKNFFGIKKGEKYVLALAIERKNDLVIIDDEKGIKACKALGLKFAISLDIVVALFENNRIERGKALKAMDKLEKYGWINRDIIRKRRKKIIGDNYEK